MTSSDAAPFWRLSVLIQTLVQRMLACLPEGRPIPFDIWSRRHDGIVRLVWLHAVGLTLATLLFDGDHLVGICGSLVIGFLGIAADRPWTSRRLRACLAAVGLLASSALLVHLTGGVIEMHFHFFVALAVIAFYQDWVVFLVAIGFVLVEHGVVGVVYPAAVYDHHAAWEHPWIWAGIHAIFVAAASTANLLGWRVNEQQALHDPLTRLPNRALFRDRTEHALAQARRRAQQVAVVFVDLDRFKPINDTWGHHVGDQVLVEVGERLRHAVREGDTVARLGGDEYAILLEDLPWRSPRARSWKTRPGRFARWSSSSSWGCGSPLTISAPATRRSTTCSG